MEEGEEAQPARPTVNGTFFRLRFGEADFIELAHAQSDGAAVANEAAVFVEAPLVRWLVERQGRVELELCRRLEGSAETERHFALPIDLAPLLFGWPRLSTRFSSSGAGERLPEVALPLVSEVEVSVSSSLPFLSDELARELNPVAVSVLRADGLPAAYSGTPFKAPFVELSERCAPVRVVWRMLGQTGVTAPRAHAEEIAWENERTIFLTGDLDEDNVRRLLREEGIVVELRDRDPKQLAPPSPREAPSGEGADGEGVEEGEPPEAEARAKSEPDPNAPAPRHPPFGVARYRLGEMVGRMPTDRASYAPAGIRSAPNRRLTLCLDVQPCERPRTRPEPEEEDVEYFAGLYVESCCQVTLQIEMAAELPPESEETLASQVQAPTARIVTLIGYKDTQALRAILGTIQDVNSACGLTSAANWENYKDTGEDALDVITGVQLVDGATRLFLLEGKPPVYGEGGLPANGMARLSILLERTEPNSKTAFTLMDSRMTFPHRLYNTFELPTKLMKLKMPLPSLILLPEIYQHLRVTDGCRDAVLTLAKLLGAPTLRVAHKHQAFPLAADLLQLDKKYSDAITRRDREGVPTAKEAVQAPTQIAERTASLSVQPGEVGIVGARTIAGRAHECRKAPTDARNPVYLRALRERAERPSVDYIQKNIEALPAPVEREPLPDWYLESIQAVRTQMGGQIVGTYSGQRLNPTEMQKAYLQKKLAEMGQQRGLGAHGQGVHHTYAADYLNADSMGEAEVRAPPPPKQKPWDNSQRKMYLRDGRRSQFEMLQPSETRVLDLEQPWGLNQYEADIRAREYSRQLEATEKPPFNALPSNRKYLEVGYPGPSVFQQTEEQIIAERREMKEGSMELWSSKVVVDDPTLRVSLKSRDKVTQQERLHGALLDPPRKKSLKKLYRGKYKLTSGNHVAEEPSIFMHESTIDGIAAFENSLRERRPEKWSSTRLANSPGNTALCSTTAARSQSHALIRSLDFAAGPVREADKRAMGIPVTKETKRFHPPLTERERAHISFSRDAFSMQMSR